MFPSSYSGSPFTYDDQPLFERHFICDVNPNSKEGSPALFFHFSPPFIDEDGLLPYHQEILEDHPLPQQQHLVANSTANTQTSVNMAAASTMSTPTSNYNHASDGNCGGFSNLNSDDKTRSVTKQMSRKRSVKKDRHSKIYTAQGPRDRRMRLSLDIAREFFDLQDMLGFDKGSRTVEWLLTKSKAAIKELKSLPQINHNCTGGTKSSSSTSECEVESGVDETFNNGDHKPGTGSRGKSLVGLSKEKRTKQSRRPLARESRANARARARERTREKNSSRALDESKQCFDSNHHNLNQLRSSSPLVETGEESGSLSYNMNSSLEVVAEVEEPSSRSLEHHPPIQDIVDNSFVMTKKPSPSSIFNYQQNIVFSQDSQFAELHELYAKPWEAYNNQSPC